MRERITIAVGIDDSWSANGAVDWALYESGLSAASIRVLHVVGDRPPAGLFHDGRGATEAGKRLVADVREYLDHRDSNGLHTAVVLSGTPAHILAQSTGNDRMLVVGRHGRGMLGRLLIGSTAEAVAYGAETAVVVVPPKWSPGDRDAPIVVGVDELEYCESAVDFAVGLAGERRAPVRLVHVWDIPTMFTGDEPDTAGTAETARRYYGDRLDATVRRCRDKYPGVSIEAELRRGHPVAGLTDAGREAGAQLLVVGGRSHRRMMALLLGGTARGILQHATGPTAIVHQPGTRPAQT
ncbi:universal stress protein [Kribbella sp. NBC_01510]|uniref:universal stress protein n=1 Tax=Kribbella sp. NBC_01510 TaxID=2903581 RepID=UPI0038696EA6